MTQDQGSTFWSVGPEPGFWARAGCQRASRARTESLRADFNQKFSLANPKNFSPSFECTILSQG